MPVRLEERSQARALTTWSRQHFGRGSGSNLQPLFESLLNWITVQIPNQSAAVYLREKGHLSLLFSSDSEKTPRYRKRLPLIQLRGLVESELTQSPDLDPRDFFLTKDSKRLAAFSLRSGKNPRGILLLRGVPGTINTRRLVKVRATIANVGTALSMLNALVQERERSSRLRLINKLCQKIDSMIGESNLYERIVLLIQEVFGYDHVGLYLVDKKCNALVLQSIAGKYRGIVPPGQRIPLGQGIVSWVASHGRTLLSNDVRDNPHFLNLTPELIPTEAELCVPIRVDDEIIGVLNVEHSELLSFDEDDINAVEVLTGRIAVAIKKSRLYEELNHSHARLEAIVSSLAQGLMIISPDFRIEWMNSTLERWGYRDALGDFCYKVFSRSPESCKNCPSQRTFATGQGYRETTKGPGDKFYTITSAPILDKRGQIVQTLELVEDVTEQLVARNVLEHLKQELERSQRLASVGEVAASIVHEVRNPINALSQAAELLQGDANLSEEQCQLMGVIREEAVRLNEIITGYLALANGKQREFHMADLRGIVERVVTLIRADQTFSRHIKVAMEFPNDLPQVYCDANAVRQVFWNLLLNSAESIEGKGCITIQARYEPPICTVDVVDDGKGISAQDIEHIFDPLHSTKGRGKGLGLAIVKRIVQDHGWKIAVGSREGEGAMFSIMINPHE